jgi:hypothetical protein
LVWPKDPRPLRATKSNTPRLPSPTDVTPRAQSVPAKPAFAIDATPDISAPVVRAPAATVHPVSVLKSGTVDGMAYTLFSDGSIEAELPQGRLRFGSISELRQHVEKSA